MIDDYNKNIWDDRNSIQDSAFANLQSPTITTFEEMDNLVGDYKWARERFKEIDNHEKELKALRKEVHYLGLGLVNMETAHCVLSFLQDERLSGNEDHSTIIIKNFFK